LQRQSEEGTLWHLDAERVGKEAAAVIANRELERKLSIVQRPVRVVSLFKLNVPKTWQVVEDVNVPTITTAVTPRLGTPDGVN
jgi:fibronectin type 3 domain-containing protein